MKPYYDEGGIVIYHGDALEVMSALCATMDERDAGSSRLDSDLGTGSLGDDGHIAAVQHTRLEGSKPSDWRVWFGTSRRMGAELERYGLRRRYGRSDLWRMAVGHSRWRS
jgi:hypothetical protein